MIQLGDYVRDRVSNFEGTVTSETRYLNNCKRFGVQPRVDKEGKLPEPIAFDEMQLEVLTPMSPPAPEVKTGGPNVKAP